MTKYQMLLNSNDALRRDLKLVKAENTAMRTQIAELERKIRYVDR